MKRILITLQTLGFGRLLIKKMNKVSNVHHVLSHDYSGFNNSISSHVKYVMLTIYASVNSYCDYINTLTDRIRQVMHIAVVTIKLVFERIL